MRRLWCALFLVVLSCPSLGWAADCADLTTSSTLEVWYKFDETSGTTTAADASGNGRDGTMVNFSGTPWTTGKVNNGLTFVATSLQSVYYGSSIDLAATTTMSLAAWVSTTSTGAYRRIVSMEANTGDAQIAIRLNDSNQADVLARGTASETTVKASTATITDGQFHHVMALVNSPAAGDVTLYLDNTLQGTTSFGTAFTNASFASIAVGAMATVSDQYWNGVIDEVRAYSCTLTSAQRTELYNYGLASGGPFRRRISIQ